MDERYRRSLARTARAKVARLDKASLISVSKEQVQLQNRHMYKSTGYKSHNRCLVATEKAALQKLLPTKDKAGEHRQKQVSGTSSSRPASEHISSITNTEGDVLYSIMAVSPILNISPPATCFLCKVLYCISCNCVFSGHVEDVSIDL